MPTKYRKTLTSLLSPLIFSLSGPLHAGSPVWTFSPLTATTISRRLPVIRYPTLSSSLMASVAPGL
jgi:hypothetical protein